MKTELEKANTIEMKYSLVTLMYYITCSYFQ